MSVNLSTTKVSLPKLPYAYDALEPIICREIMELHHSKHHQAYVNNYNAAMEKMANAVAKGDITAAVGLQGAIKFNGGGHLNHSIFWQNLCPKKESGSPPPALLKEIERDFGSLQAMRDKLSASTVAVQGSGWGWLGYNKVEKKLQVATCKDQVRPHLPMQSVITLLPLGPTGGHHWLGTPLWH